MPLAIFGITDDTLNLVVNLFILFLVVLWLALVAWTYFDARRRIEDPFLVSCAAVAAFVFPFLGPIVYSILRPPEFLDDRRERELDLRALGLRLRHLEEHSCPNCEYPVERNFLRCPSCKARIKDPCESCAKPIDPRWSLCPYCETPVRRAPPEPASEPGRRSRRASERKSAKRPAASDRSKPTDRVSPAAERVAAASSRRPKKPAKAGAERNPRTAEQPIERRTPRASGPS